MAFSKIIMDGVTLMDVTQDTVTAPTLKQGETAHGADGVQITGTMGGGATDGDVIFIDYDGTVVDAKTKAEINAMTSDSDLPANPTHTGLTAQGWNWTVAQLKAQLMAMPDQKVYVGQMYITSSGATEIDVVMYEGRLNPTLTICVNGTISIDWGDGTTPDSVTGNSYSTRLAVPHTYAMAGDYTISISKTDESSYAFYGSGDYTLLRKNTTQSENYVYSNAVKHIRIGNNARINNYAFSRCTSLVDITIPNNISSVSGYSFYNCFSLASIIIPSGVTGLSANTFANCYSLETISIPSSITSIGNASFSSCYKISNIAIVSNISTIGLSAFYQCYSLDNISIPSSVTSIGNSAFYNCYSLSHITLPSNVEDIGSSAFSTCYGVAEYHINSTTPPSLGATAFASIASDCVIYVPYSEDHSILNNYQTASNWSTYASYMQEEPS